LPAQIILPLPTHTNQPDTNRFRISITFDAVTNAQWYGGILFSNGVEIQRRYSMENFITFSNLIGNLTPYQFFVVASNSLPFAEFDGTNWTVNHYAPESDISAPAPKKWTTVTNVYSTNLDGPWLDLPSNSFEPTNEHVYYRTVISNFDASTLLLPQ
jgi:hypothetical protein